MHEVPDGETHSRPTLLALLGLLLITGVCFHFFDTDELLIPILHVRLPHDWAGYLMPAMGLLAKIEQLSGNYAEAEKLCRRVLVKTPFDTDVHYTLFRSLSDQGKPEAVAEEQRYKQLVEYRQRVDVLIQQMDRSKDKPDALAELGNLLINLGQEEEGLHWLGMALKRDPNHASTHEILAAYYDSHGEPAKAAEHRKNISSP